MRIKKLSTSASWINLFPIYYFTGQLKESLIQLHCMQTFQIQAKKDMIHSNRKMFFFN